MIYELREYVAHENAVDQVHARFAEHTLPLFTEHGLEPVGFWTDSADPTRVLYLLRFEDEAAQKRAWAGFQADTRWQEAKRASEEDGPIVAEMLSRTLEPVSYWSAPNSANGAANS